MPGFHRLPHVDPHARGGPVYRLFVGFASTRFMTWLARTRPWGLVIWRIDPVLMRVTRGRLRTGALIPTALLETRGARTGRVRRNAVVYFHDGEQVTIIASQAGRPENPSWFYNARANPDVLLGSRPFRAEVIQDEAERARLWQLADRVLPAFARYRETAARAGRSIPILRLTPQGIPDQGPPARSGGPRRRRFPGMALKNRLADASYWIYDRMRHKTAFDSAARPGTAQDFAGLHGHKYALLVTFRRDGTAVPTPVWFALLDDRRLVTHTEERTAKVRRIRRDPQARVFPCDPRGKPLGPGVEATAQIIGAEEERELAEAALDHHYGRTRRIYDKLMVDEGGMVYLELVPAATTAPV